MIQSRHKELLPLLKRPLHVGADFHSDYACYYFVRVPREHQIATDLILRRVSFDVAS